MHIWGEYVENYNVCIFFFVPIRVKGVRIDSICNTLEMKINGNKSWKLTEKNSIRKEYAKKILAF